MPESQAKEIKDWYNGYQSECDLEIYNPWSIVKCLNSESHKLASYWEESGSIEFIKGLFKIPLIKSKIDILVQDLHFAFTLKNKISVYDLEVLRTIMMMNLGSNYKITEETNNILFSYLFAAGYLSIDKTSGKYKLPNNEIKKEFQ